MAVTVAMLVKRVYRQCILAGQEQYRSLAIGGRAQDLMRACHITTGAARHQPAKPSSSVLTDRLDNILCGGWQPACYATEVVVSQGIPGHTHQHDWPGVLPAGIERKIYPK
jgi:hypothetical protein